ncbi:hypothetical protein OEZ85_011540 [Tetradesmus obliquus]|uniref:Uncharacterized protein n=1 Tax=Tetradesmus obliquus TaxID=3088 RepID=A0ABY8TSR2_TETOB|nr:hypothetical protein OEZ85_011540 [Tetradesmus obliquus]
MDQQVMRSYREASVVTDTLAELGVLLRFVHMWDAAAYKAKQHSVAQLRRDMLLLKDSLLGVAGAAAGGVWQPGRGLLQLQTSFLKTSYMAKLAAAQATLAMMLVSAARKECQAATAELQSLARDLAAQPSKLGEFISFRLRVREVQAARDRVSGLRPAQVQDLYATATSWGGRLPHADQVALHDLQEALRCFGRALTAAVAFLNSRQAGMLALLDRQAKELLKRELLKQLEAAAMAQRLGIPAASGLDVTADKLAAWQQQRASLCEAAAGINQQESRLGVKLTYYADLDEAGRVLKEIQEAHAAKAAGGSGGSGNDAGDMEHPGC